MIGLDLRRSLNSDRFLFPAVGVAAGVVAFAAVHLLWPSGAGGAAATGRDGAHAQTTAAQPFAPSPTTSPIASPTTSLAGTLLGPALYPAAGGGLADTAGAAGTVTIPAAGSDHHDGTPTNPAVFTATRLSRTYNGGATAFDLSVDAGVNVAHAPQVRLSYDLTGDGTWDRVDTYRYFATDPTAGYERYTSAVGLASSTGSFGNLVGGTIKVEIWNALGANATTLGTGSLSRIVVPYAEPSTPPRTSTQVQVTWYLQSGGTLSTAQGSAASVTLPALGAGNRDNVPTKPVVFTGTGITASLSGEATEFDLSVDAGLNVGHATQVRISYDLTGDGTWDRVETYRYFATDAVGGYEHYTQSTGPTVATGKLTSLSNGRIMVEVWNAIGANATTLGVGNESRLVLPQARE
jgi:hypothetical protein